MARPRRTQYGDVLYPDKAPGTDMVPEIQHIVVLMMQGHSFDNYLGTSGRGDGFALGPEGLPTDSNRASTGLLVPAHHLRSTTQRADAPIDTLVATTLQFGDGTNDGFVESIERTAPGADSTVGMGYWTADDLPFYHALAQTFPLADRWFSSFLGPGLTNRRFLVAGTAHGLIDELPFSAIDEPAAGTILHLLDEHGITWRNYQGNVSQVSAILPRLLGLRTLIVGRRVLRWLSRINPLQKTTLRGQPKFTADIYPLGLRDAVRHLRSAQQFFADASAGTLPSVSIVDPDFDATSGRNPQDVQYGESFVAAVVNAVMHGPGWPHTLLIWLQDNGGGYYDHVPPPPAIPPDDVPAMHLFAGSFIARLTRRSAFARQLEHADAGPIFFDRLGFRVPAVIVSPYARSDHVSHTVYDHTSVLALIERKWNLPALTRRDAAAADPIDMIDLDTPPAFLSPPLLPPPALGAGRPGAGPLGTSRPPLVDASGAFRVGSARDLTVRLLLVMAAWGIGFFAFNGRGLWLQSVVFIGVTWLTVQGVRDSGFWRQWMFWRPRRQSGLLAIYNTAFAVVALSAFSALASAALYRYGPFRVAGHPSGTNIFWLYTGTYVWNLVDAVPALGIPDTLHWNSPLEVSGVWGELFLLLFRLLVLAPALSAIIQAAQGEERRNEQAVAKPEADRRRS